MNYDIKEVTQVASKYLDRVKIEGLQEFHEFGFLINFLAELERGALEVKPKQEDDS